MTTRTTFRKTYDAQYVKALDRGRVTALVAVFGNVDLQGDRTMPGCFELSLLKWAASGNRIPVIWSHSWQEPFEHIGYVVKAQETERGLEVEYQLDVDTNPTAAQVYRLLRDRRITEHSWAYDVLRERKADDGANELLEVDLIEVGPCLKGANPLTEVLGVKGDTVPAHHREVYNSPEHWNDALDTVEFGHRPYRDMAVVGKAMLAASGYDDGEVTHPAVDALVTETKERAVQEALDAVEQERWEQDIANRARGMAHLTPADERQRERERRAREVAEQRRRHAESQADYEERERTDTARRQAAKDDPLVYAE
jgi:HK97 family phage prohead protease